VNEEKKMILTLQIGEDPALRDFAQDAIHIGRSSSGDIVLDDRRVSRQHARIERIGEEFRVVDLGSGNGTLLNGRKIKSEPLMTGDVVQIGRTPLTVMRLRSGAPSPTDGEFAGLSAAALQRVLEDSELKA
jgi:adenylate cyclase